MAKKINDVYQIVVKGESESDWRAAVPEDIRPLIDSQANKNVAGLYGIFDFLQGIGINRINQTIIISIA